MFKKVFVFSLFVSVLFADLIVGIPGGYKKVFPQILQKYNQRYHTNVKAIYGPLGFLIGQAKLKNVDLIMGEKDKLMAHNFKNFTPIGYGKMVILANHKITSIEDLRKIKLLALPDPKHTMYGKAAQEAFSNMNVFPKTMKVALMPQGINYLLMGNVDCAVANITQAVLLKNKLYYFQIPQKYYTPIILGFVNISNKKENKRFLQFIKQKSIAKILAKYGI